MKISKELIPYTYEESKRIFENGLSVNEAAENINKNCGIKITSSRDYPRFFKHLMTGNGSCRRLSSYSQEYYLSQIFQDYGKEQLIKSLEVFKLLIEKFEQSNNVAEVIYEKYIKAK